MKQLVVLILANILLTGLAAAAGSTGLTFTQKGDLLASTVGTTRVQVTATLTADATTAANLSALSFEAGFSGAYTFVAADFSTAAASQVENPTTIDFTWTTLPDLSQPYTFSYQVEYPTADAWDEISGTATYQTDSVPTDTPTITTALDAMNCLELVHTIVNDGYVAGQPLTVQVTINSNCQETVTALALEETLPTGWSFSSASGVGDSNQVLVPDSGDTGVLQFLWFSPIPSFPYTFTFDVSVPAGTSGGKDIQGVLLSRLSGGELRTNPLVTTISSKDVTDPVVTINGSAIVQVTCGGNYTDAGATALDDVDGALPVTTVNNVNTFVPQLYTVSYSATDSSGNEGTASRLVNVVDSTAPVLQLTGNNPMTVQCGSIFSDPGATATDACAGNLTSSINVTNPVNTSVLGAYTVTYAVEDPSGNDNSITRTVNVVDTTPPVVSLVGNPVMDISCGSSFTDPGVTAIDSCSGSNNTVQVINPVNTSIVGPYTVTYRATDTNDNQSAAVTRTVNVVDTTPPVITLNGSNPVTITCGSTYTEAGATVTDLCAGTLSTNLAPEGPVVTNTAGTYQLTYRMSDPSGNAAVAVTRTVNVVDTTKPVLSLNGASEVTIGCGASYSDAGATALDTCAGTLTNISVDNPVAPATPGVYTVTYSVSDPSGNAADPITRTVTVADTTAPVLTLNGASSVTIACKAVYTDSGATASDNCAGDITNAIVVNNPVDPAVPGTYQVVYNVADPSGNNAAAISRTVTVEDTVPPVLTLNGPSEFSVECGALFSFLDPGASATDACGGDLTSAVQRTGTIDNHIPNDYTYTFTVSDASGNAATPVTRVYHVVDTTAPSISLYGDNPLTLDCGQTYQEPGAMAIDSCDGAVTVDITDVVIDSSIPGSYTVTYTAEDSSGNSDTAERTINVSGPTCPTEGETVYCPLESVHILTPGDTILIPSAASTVNVAITSDTVFNSEESCIYGTTQVAYTLNGTAIGNSADMANHFPLSVPLKMGTYTLIANATVSETGETVSEQHVFEIYPVQIAPNGYLNIPFDVLRNDGTNYTHTIQDGYYDRSITMVSALCPADGGSTEDITIEAHYAGDTTQTLTVTIPRSLIPCGHLSIIVVTVSDTLSGLLGPDEAALLTPVPGGLIAGALFFDISIIEAALTDIDDNDGVTTYWEIDNNAVAQNPIHIVLNGLNFTPNLVPVYLSHPSDMLPSDEASVNLLGIAGNWTYDYTRNFEVNGTTLSGDTTSLSVFAPFEKEMTLKFTPNVAYGVIFGRTAHDTSIDQKFTVTNTGELTITGEVTVIDGADTFKVVGDSAYTLAPGQSQQVTIRFTPPEMLDYTGRLHFSGDPKGELYVTLRGTGTTKQKWISIFGCSPLSNEPMGGDWLVLALTGLALTGLTGRRLLQRQR